MIQTGEKLLEHIVDTPDDTEARLVYADWLLERGDARGELIRLQCEALHRPLGEREEKRLRGLLRSGSKTWLGPIAAVTEVRSRVWDRGFLAAARIESGRFREMQSAIGHPEWKTVRFLNAACHQNALELVTHPAMRSLRTVTRLLASQFRALAEDPRHQGLEELALLEWRSGGENALTALGACPALPRLRVLVIGERSPEEIPWLFESPLCAQIDVFGMDYNIASIASWQVALDRVEGFKVARIGFGSFECPAEARLGFQMTLARGDGGAWSRVVLRRPPTQTPDARLVNELGSMHVTELVFVGFEEQEASEIAKRARDLPRITMKKSCDEPGPRGSLL